MKPYYEDTLVTLYHADTNELWPNLKPEGALVTDPPYGLRKERRRAWHGGNGRTRLNSDDTWDYILSDLVENKLLNFYSTAIIWGGNFYKLPPTDSWLVWDKLQDNRGSDAEMAWARLDKRGCRVYRMSRIDAYYNKRMFVKEHPTEKPIQLMQWCIDKLPVHTRVIDVFAGVGTTLIAAKMANRRAVGIELDERYCEIASKRLSQINSK